MSHGCSGWFFISIICKYGEISAGVGILEMFPGYAYFLSMSVRSPPLAGVYGILCCIHLVSACVLLKISLCFGNKFCMYFVDFVAVSLVSWIVIMAGLFVVLDIRWWRFGRAVFSEEAFHVLIYVLWFVIWVNWAGIGGVLGSGGGWEYSSKGLLYLSVSMSNFWGRNGNSFVISCMFSVPLFCLMKLYISL